MSTDSTDIVERLRDIARLDFRVDAFPAHLLDTAGEAVAEIERLRAALIRARGFIQNGIALGYIRMPDPDLPDTAHEVPGIIDAALGISGHEHGHLQ